MIFLLILTEDLPHYRNNLVLCVLMFSGLYIQALNRILSKRDSEYGSEPGDVTGLPCCFGNRNCRKHIKDLCFKSDAAETTPGHADKWLLVSSIF